MDWNDVYRICFYNPSFKSNRNKVNAFIHSQRSFDKDISCYTTSKRYQPPFSVNTTLGNEYDDDVVLIAVTDSVGRVVYRDIQYPRNYLSDISACHEFMENMKKDIEFIYYYKNNNHTVIGLNNETQQAIQITKDTYPIALMSVIAVLMGADHELDISDVKSDDPAVNHPVSLMTDNLMKGVIPFPPHDYNLYGEES